MHGPQRWSGTCQQIRKKDGAPGCILRVINHTGLPHVPIARVLVPMPVPYSDTSRKLLWKCVRD